MQDKHKHNPRHKQTMSRRSAGKRQWNTAEKLLLAGLSALACLVVVLAILYVTLVRPPQQDEPNIHVPAQPNSTDAQSTAQLQHREGVYNILICGADESTLRTDAMLIAHMNTRDHTTALVSIPRDTLCSRPDSEEAVKLNSVYAFGGLNETGMELLTDELSSMLGFCVDGYMLIQLDAFAQIVDLMGGVEYDVPEDMFYEDPSQDLYIDLKAGLQRLDGQQTIQLCRFRGYPTADIQRCSVQQDLLRTLTKQFADQVRLSDLQNIAGICHRHVTTDLSVGNLIYFGRELLRCDLTQTEMTTLPGIGTVLNGVSYWILDADASLDCINAVLNPYEEPLTSNMIKIRTE